MILVLVRRVELINLNLVLASFKANIGDNSSGKWVGVS